MSFLKTYIILCLLNLCDFLITTQILLSGGYEANPVQFYMIVQFGYIGMLYLKVPLLLILAAMLYFLDHTPRTNYLLMALNVIYGVVVVYSLGVLYYLNM